MFHQEMPEITTSDCDASVGCYKHPTSCTSSKDCKILVKYKYENDKVHVTVATNNTSGYVGWAQSTQKNKMVGAF